MRTIILLTILLNLSFNLLSCQETSYDKDLFYFDNAGGGLRLTILGCLTNGPWNLPKETIYHNRKIILENKIIFDEKKEIDSIKRDLVFELRKDGKMYYWFKQNFSTQIDSLESKYGIKRKTINDSSRKDTEKIYKIGQWMHNTKDSTVKLQFNSIKIKDMLLKYKSLQNGFCEFQEFSDDTIIINDKIQKVQVINSYYYETLYPYF